MFYKWVVFVIGYIELLEFDDIYKDRDSYFGIILINFFYWKWEFKIIYKVGISKSVIFLIFIYVDV